MIQDAELYRIIGEMQGQLREVADSVKLMATKIDDLARQVSMTNGLPERLDDHENRLRRLEDRENERNGAIGLTAWLAKSPILVWLSALALAGWFALKGKSPL